MGKVIGFDWLQLSALIPSSIATSDSDISSHGSLCSSACNALLLQNNRKSSSSSNSDALPCDSFWCRNNPSPWGSLAASDARSLDPTSWNSFQKSSTGLHPIISPCILSLLIYLTVL